MTNTKQLGQVPPQSPTDLNGKTWVDGTNNGGEGGGVSSVERGGT